VIQKLFDQNIFIYTMIGLFGLGIILKFMVKTIYSHMIKASDNMGTSKNKLMKNMKLKFITFYKLKIGVNNVDIFVDKYISKHKFLGILLITWEKFSGQTIILCALVGSIGAVLGVIYEIGSQGILSVFSVGILTSGLLIFFDGLFNINSKKEIIRLNIMDYLDNYLKARLEQEENNPELLEKYKKEYINSENKESENNSLDYIAVADSYSQEKLSRKERRERKRGERIQKKLNAKLEKQRKKEQKKATKEFKKQTKNAAKIKRKEDKQRRKLEAKQEIKRLKRESKLEKLRKQEEKQMQAEIKRTLKLEKQPAYGNRRTIQRTPAQERKESLKKEIRERRQIKPSEHPSEVDDLEMKVSDDTDMNNKKSLGKEDIHVAATIEKEENRQEDTIKFVQPERRSANKRSQKKKHQDNHLDEQIIEDILKEFLA
jgi:hypothetical protein